MKKIILPKFLLPKFKTELTRLGRMYDGGYVIPKLSLKETDTLFSFGLADDWSFEKEFKKKTGARVFCFDHSVTSIFWFKKFIKDLINFFLLRYKTKEHFKNFFSFFYYKIFFNNPETFHVKSYFGPIGQSIPDINNAKIIDLKTILKSWTSKSFFMKVDIEGNEYRVLDQIIKYQAQLSGLVIEFHNCDLMYEKIKSFIEELELSLVHIHVNNFGIITKDGFPAVLELTFSPNKYNSKRREDENNFPMEFLDQPNNKDEKDFDISFQ